MKKKIVLAGTLKPVDDVRAFEKIAQSMAKTNKYEINIIGNRGKKESNHSDIIFIPHEIKRSSFLQRYLIRFILFWKILKIAPELLVITTHELLIAGALVKVFTRCRIIYDVQEDFKKNLSFLGETRLWKKAVGHTIRLKERLIEPLVNEFWLAEKVYLHELGFVANKSLVLENMATDYSFKKVSIKKTQVLFSGTISHYSQILLAIDCFEKLRAESPTLSLKIIGQCHDSKLHRELNNRAKTNPYLQLMIEESPVAHELILNEIQNATLGIISYQENPVNHSKVPTKLYEYSRYRLPYLIQSGTSWEKRGIELGGAIPINFRDPDVSFILQQLKEPSMLFPEHYPFAKTWESQEEKLLLSVDTLLK